MESNQLKVLDFTTSGISELPIVAGRVAELGKASVRLQSTDILTVTAQVIGEGGENNLHSHKGSDALWFTVSGSARFYGDGDEVIAEVGPLHGVVIPRGFRYWFESSSPEQLVILRIAAQDVRTDDERIDVTPQKREITHSSL